MSGANVIELLQSSVDFSTGDNEKFKDYLESCLEHGTFYCRDSIEPVIKVINNSLNSSFDKEKGLILLNAFLSQISVEAFSNNAVSWMVSCNKIILQNEGNIYNLGLKVLSKLIKLSVNFPEVSKETGKQVVPKFLLDHVRRKASSQVTFELLECLQACMSEYSGPSGEFRLDILNLLVNTVEARADVVRAAAKCIPLLARVGGGGKQGVSHKTAWRRQQLALVALLHTLLSQLYEHVDCATEVESVASDDLQITLVPVSEKNILYKAQRLVAQFTSVAQFLQTMLLEEFPVAKSVAPDAILDVVAHAQKPTHTVLDTSREALAVISILPTIQVAALRLLESLVVCLGRNLAPRGGLVCYLCSQVIVWTQQIHSDWPYAMDKPYSRTRFAAYCCLYSWLSVAGPTSQVETLVDKSLPTILADIHAKKPTVRLKVGSRTSKGKKKQQMLVSQEDRSAKLGDIAANCCLCEQALQTLTLLIKSATPTIKPDNLTAITKTVLTLVSELPVPYSDVNCLSALYQLLLTLCLEPHPKVVPPLAPALATFTAGLHHPAPQVRVFCASALSSLDQIVHPTAATLYFPAVVDKQKPVQENEKEIDLCESTAKRRRVESSNSESAVSIVLDDSNDKTNVLDVEGKNIEEIMEVGASNDSEEIVEVFSSVSKPQDAKENISQNSGSDSVDVEVLSDEEPTMDIETKNDEVTHLTADENEGNSLNQKDSEQCSNTNGHEVEEDVDKIDIALKQDSSSITDVNDTVKSESNDADVSQMLMDFKDEVNVNEN